MRTEIVKIIQYLREGDQEKAEAFAKQLKINSERFPDSDDKRFAKRVLDAFYDVPVDPEKTVCLDGLINPFEVPGWKIAEHLLKKGSS